VHATTPRVSLCKLLVRPIFFAACMLESLEMQAVVAVQNFAPVVLSCKQSIVHTFRSAPAPITELNNSAPMHKW
jgi:hypothetical protein